MELKEIWFEGPDGIQLKVGRIQRRVGVTTVMKVMVTYQWGNFMTNYKTQVLKKDNSARS